MRKLILAILLLPLTALADSEFSYVSNQLGGTIFFTATRCIYLATGKVVPNKYYVYSTDQNGNRILDGCYEYAYPFYLVKWNSGVQVSVPVYKVEILK